MRLEVAFAVSVLCANDHGQDLAIDLPEAVVGDKRVLLENGGSESFCLDGWRGTQPDSGPITKVTGNQSRKHKLPEKQAEGFADPVLSIGVGELLRCRGNRPGGVQFRVHEEVYLRFCSINGLVAAFS